MADKTIYQVLRETASKHGGRPALSKKRGESYLYISYADLLERVRALRSGLVTLGLEKGDRVAILSENRPEWAIADLAAQALGAITVPIYSTLPIAQIRYMIEDSGARLLIVSDKKQIQKAMELASQVSTLERVIAMDAPPDAATDSRMDGVLSFEEILAGGRADQSHDVQLDEQAASIRPDDVATLIYTSGTTGDPKGAMLSHRSLLNTPFAAIEFVPLDEREVFLSFAPLSHIVERTGGYYLPLLIGACIVYSEGLFAIAGEFAAVKPTVFLCVPRLYESIHDRVLEQAGRAPAKKKRVFEWALSIALRAAERRCYGKRAGLLLTLQAALADRLALRQVREKATGGRARFFVAGGAPLNPQTALFFDAIGVRLLEGYGLTECPVISLNRPDWRRPGTVGPPLPGMEVKIAPDGEILAKGPALMRGYFDKPEATAEAIDSEGWLHTGDVGEITREGLLRITDRKKDIIVLANGKNVAPQPIEARLKESPFIAEAVLLGDRANTIVALIAPAFDRLKSWAREQKLESRDPVELIARAETRRLFKDELDRLSANLADFEKVKRFTLIDQPFTIEGGELTPTLKVKRKVVAAKYAAQIEQMLR